MDAEVDTGRDPLGESRESRTVDRAGEREQRAESSGSSGSIATRHTSRPPPKPQSTTHTHACTRPAVPLAFVPDPIFVCRSWALASVAHACFSRYSAGRARTTVRLELSWCTRSESAETLLVRARTRVDSRLFGQIMSTSSNRELANRTIAWCGSGRSVERGVHPRIKGD